MVALLALFKEGDAELVLQAFQTPADGGAVDVQQVCRGGVVTGAHGYQEYAKVVPIQHGANLPQSSAGVMCKNARLLGDMGN